MLDGSEYWMGLGGSLWERGNIDACASLREVSKRDVIKNAVLSWREERKAWRNEIFSLEGGSISSIEAALHINQSMNSSVLGCKTPSDVKTKGTMREGGIVG